MTIFAPREEPPDHVWTAGQSTTTRTSMYNFLQRENMMNRNLLVVRATIGFVSMAIGFGESTRTAVRKYTRSTPPEYSHIAILEPGGKSENLT